MLGTGLVSAGSIGLFSARGIGLVSAGGIGRHAWRYARHHPGNIAAGIGLDLYMHTLYVYRFRPLYAYTLTLCHTCAYTN